VQQLAEGMHASHLQVLDVRRDPEWQAGHIQGASLWPLDKFAAALPEVDKSLPVAVHCKSGYRSVIACCLLRRAGFQNVINVAGGFNAWQQAQLPFVTEAPVQV
jgi:rhodanese-related sulfurtransferase